MTNRSRATIAFFFIPLTAITLVAQMIIRRSGNDKEGQPFLLQELGAVIIASNGTLKVEHVMPKDERSKAYAEADLQEGDIIMMGNQKALKSTKDLQQLYESVAIGSEVKLGLKRGEQMFIVTILKADPKDLPKMRIQIGGGGDDVAALPAVGVLLKSVGNKVIIAEKLDDVSTALAKADVKANDQVIALNKKTVRSLKSFTDAYDGLTVGSLVEWSLRRGAKTLTVSFAKPQPRGRVVRREAKN
jgi:S1-C subfamily serine protease